MQFGLMIDLAAVESQASVTEDDVVVVDARPLCWAARINQARALAIVLTVDNKLHAAIISEADRDKCHVDGLKVEAQNCMLILEQISKTVSA
jgi:hypothetical protein